jgi:hypothetical protein
MKPTHDENDIVIIDDDDDHPPTDSEDELWKRLDAAHEKALQAHRGQHHGPIQIKNFACQ